MTDRTEGGTESKHRECTYFGSIPWDTVRNSERHSDRTHRDVRTLVTLLSPEDHGTQGGRFVSQHTVVIPLMTRFLKDGT